MKYFVTSSGTGIGKTLVTAMLCHQLKERGDNVRAFKPVISGFAEHDKECDSHILLESLGLERSTRNINEVSPFRFKAPLSPHMAAEMEGKQIDFEKLIEVCQKKISDANGYLFIEGAGGVMAPITRARTFLDLIGGLELPAILVTGSYLGAISHTLTACEALKRRARIHSIVVSESEESPMPVSETAGIIHSLTGIKTTILPRLNNIDYKWKQSFPILDELEI